MTANSIKILIAEDEMIIAADISRLLNKMGYEVTGISTRGEDVLKVIESTRPDIILMDIALRGKLDGVETALQILQTHQIPVIFVTSNADDLTFQRAKAAKPYAFIAKPFQKADLQRAIVLTLERITLSNDERPKQKHIELQDNAFFVHHKDQMVKVVFDDILFVEADRNYCKLYTDEKEYLLSLSLATVETRLPAGQFLRTHRSFLVNKDKIDVIGENNEFLSVHGKVVPLSRRSREQVLKQLNIL